MVMSVFGWEPLQPGDAVAVVTPAGSVDPVKFERGLALLRSWGLDVRVGEHVVTTPHGQKAPLYAGPDRNRMKDLLWALTDSSIRAVLIGRGGYGVMRILDQLDLSACLRSCDRPVIGYSDITCVHAALRAHSAWSSFLGPHVAGGLGVEQPDELTISSLQSLLFRGELTAPFVDDTVIVRHGVVAAPIVGGNLSMLAAMVGSAEGTPPKTPFIAAIEDVHESPYRVDRLLTQLLRSGWFTHCVGILGGTWEGCGDVEPVLRERLDGIDGPIVFNTAFGHGDQHVPIALGVPTTLDTVSGALRVGIST
jgi:muramoyltetrapeptide carboxypeptidase